MKGVVCAKIGEVTDSGKVEFLGDGGFSVKNDDLLRKYKSTLDHI